MLAVRIRWDLDDFGVGGDTMCRLVYAYDGWLLEDGELGQPDVFGWMS